MRLAKLTLSGFKSFADRTEFTFDDAVTGIVGPNGCGKSNVVDAIKWVLGERSSKSLRGKEMIDVIFAGSAARKPAGMASVSLTFENPMLAHPLREIDPETDSPDAVEPETFEPVAEDSSSASHALSTSGQALAVEEETPSRARAEDNETETVLDRRAARRRALPIDADEVEVERRLYRDGTSKYLINGRTARLKDIRGLFLDTGIGADAYSIIEQGKVDAMLLASPQERRTIFEEAAGVARYRQQRTEATRKLEKTERNLTQLREQLASTERRLRLVRGQAAKARKFTEFDAELRAWRVALALDQHHDLLQRIDGLTSRLSGLTGEREQAIDRVEKIEQEKLDAEINRSELVEQRRRIERERDASTHEASSAGQTVAHLRATLASATERIEGDLQRLEHLRETLESLEAQARAAIEQRRVCETSLAEADLAHKAASARKTDADRALAEHRRTRDEHLASAVRIERERTRIEASSEADARRLESIEEDLQRIERRKDELTGEHEATSGRRIEACAQRDSHAEALAQVRERIEALHARVGSLADGRGALTQDVAQLRESCAGLEARRQTLSELIETRAELGEPARHALERRDEGDPALRAILGTLSELIDAESMPAELEAALGAKLGWLVFDPSKGWPSPAALASLPGRVTLLPIQARTGGACELPAALRGRVTPLREAARPTPGPHADAVRAMLDRLLGRTLLVESLEAARLLAAGPLAGWRFVTRDGVVLDTDGCATAGGAPTGAESTGLLQRKAELREIESVLAETTETLRARRATLEHLDAEATSIDTDLATALRERAEIERAHGGAVASIERAEHDLRRLALELERCDKDARQIVQRRESIESDRSAQIAKAESLQRLETEQRELGESLSEKVVEAQRELEDAVQKLTEAGIEAGRLREQVDASARASASASAHLDRARSDSASLEASTESNRREIERCGAQIAEAMEAGRVATERAESLSAQLDGLIERGEEADGKIREISERLRIARDRAGQLDRDWHSLEVSRRELEVKRETLEDRAREESSLDLERDACEYRWMLANGGVEPVDHDEASKAIADLREAIRALGNVNLDAIHEETTLDEASGRLTGEVADLDEARVRLTDLIGRLNDLSKQRFADAFERIRGEFGGKNGMFRQLFGGGHAEVRLMPLVKEVDGEKVVTDIIDPLESGVEVIAKPPGKEPRSISQLSGGEKTMTAVALLLSIFRSKPSCFCVLDEVDAALDDSNVERFAKVVRRYTDKSHFIVITHNKRTMATADRLFGVTMQERGVSTRVAVRFGQAGARAEHDAEIADQEPSIDPETFADGPTLATDKRPSGGLREALASMRSSREPAEISAD